LTEGRAAYERGDFLEAHELWEAVWREAEGRERRWLGGLIQLAAARHHLARGRRGRAARLLARALEKLADAPAVLGGIAVDALRGWASSGPV
jgi:predicted metal-dependent hydrolase